MISQVFDRVKCERHVVMEEAKCTSIPYYRLSLLCSDIVHEELTTLMQ